MVSGGERSEDDDGFMLVWERKRHGACRLDCGSSDRDDVLPYGDRARVDCATVERKMRA